MENLLKKISDILEVSTIDTNWKFSDFDEWDSLSSLAIVALLESDYNMFCTYAKLEKFENIREFCEFVLNNGK